MAAHTRATILNVDDHEAGRYARSRTLRNAGFEVVEASSGSEALELAVTRQPQLVLLDINLPDMTGYEVCRRIKATSHSKILVLHISATFVKGSDQKRGLEGGADGYLAEPVEQQVLVATVHAFLRLRSAEEALRESEERFRTVFEEAPVGMALVDGSHRIFRVNRALAEILGDKAVDDLDLTIEELGLPEDAEETAMLTQQLFGGEIDGFRRERGCRTRKADTVWIDLTCRAIRNVDGEILYGLVMAENISEAKKTEEKRNQLLAAEQKARTNAENANRAKDQFLATVSHELRTPLGAILGWARILRNQPHEDPTMKRGLEAIERNAIAQAQLIEDILDVSRIISGKLRLALQTVDLISIIRAAADSIKPAVEAKRIHLEARLDSSPIFVTCDPDRVQQVIWNLLSNAVKFSPKEGHVVIEMETVNSDQVQVSVVDAGLGIPASFLPYVFDPFRQADGSTTRAHGGLGLGLSIVKQLIELHGGTVEALSEGPGRGATFKVRFPKAAHPRDAGEATPEIGEPATQSLPPPLAMKLPRLLEGMKVLAVDDELDARELISFILEKGGAIVQVAASAVEALKLLPSLQPDLIVADIGMPKDDGYALIREVRAMATEHVAVTPALALTAYARAEDRVQALAAGYQGHLTKPVEPAELILTAARLLKNAGIVRTFGQAPV